jgi:outer membrane protein assembly factor BamB
MSILGGVLKKIAGKKAGTVALHRLVDLGAESMTPPVCQDIDGDGNLEVVCSTARGEVFVFDEELNIKWKFSAYSESSEEEEMFRDRETGNSIATPPKIFDVNGDGKKELLFGTENGDVFCINCKGGLLWNYRTEGAIRGGINVFYLGQEKKIRVLFGNSDRKMYILNEKGKTESVMELKSGIEATPIIFEGLIVVGTDRGEVQAYSIAGRLQWSSPRMGAKITSEAVPLKLQDGTNCFLIGSADNNLYCFNSQGDIIWSFRTEGSIYSKAAVADINGDGVNEIMVGSADNKLHVLTLDGSEIWNFETDFWIIGTPVSADVDCDGAVEVVAGSYDNKVYFFTGEGSYIIDYVPGISGIVAQGGSYSDIPVSSPGAILGNKIWEYRAPGIVVGCAVLGNRIAVQTKEGKVLILKHSKE